MLGAEGVEHIIVLLIVCAWRSRHAPNGRLVGFCACVRRISRWELDGRHDVSGREANTHTQDGWMLTFNPLPR